MNQILIKYAIYENHFFSEERNTIVEEDVSKRPPTWYAKFGDKTMLMVPNKDSTNLEEKYQDWIKKDKEDAQKLVHKDLVIIFEYKSKDKSNENIKMKYKGVVFLPEKMRSGFEVGYLSNVELHANNQTNEKENKDENKKANTRAAYLYRITDHIVTGDKKGVEDFRKQFKAYFQNLDTFDCESDYMYSAIEGMSSENREGLMNGLKIECGVIVKLVEKDKEIRNNDEEGEDEKEEEIKTSRIVEEEVKRYDSNHTKKRYLRIKGKLAIKALGIIYNHPAVAFERSKYFHVYPKNWIKNNLLEASMIQLKKSFPVQTGLFEVSKGSDEFSKISDYFYKSMDKNVFEITTILVYQNPIKFESYYYNLRNVQIKSTSSICSSDNDFKDWKNFTPFYDDSVSCEKWLFHLKRYQKSHHEILGTDNKINNKSLLSEDCGLLPFKKVDVDKDKIKDTNYMYDQVDVPDDNCCNLGNNALYFTINPNKNPTLLYSHGEEHGFYEKDNLGDLSEYVQLLCRVVTGFERDKTKDIVECIRGIEDSDDSKKQDEYKKKFQEMRSTQLPDLIPNNEIDNLAKKEIVKDEHLIVNWFDSNMYDCAKIDKDELKNLYRYYIKN